MLYSGTLKAKIRQGCYGNENTSIMDMTSECPNEPHYPEDTASFEVFDLSAMSVSSCSGSSDYQREPVDRAKMKSKLISAWNNVRYSGWSIKSKPRLSKTSPVYLLGHRYLLSFAGERESFRRAFSSLLWLTYRRGFPQLDGSSLTSDLGWGCMLRSGQMLLAQGLVLHLMPSDWTWPATHHRTKDDLEMLDSRQLSVQELSNGVGGRDGAKQKRKSLGSEMDIERGSESTHRKVVAWFGDQPGVPFGLHQLVKMGEASGRRAGDWYGPSIVAHMLCKAVNASEVSDLAVYVAQDCTVYVGDVMRLCESAALEFTSCRSAWKSVIILVPVRLGGDTLNPAYIESVKNLLRLECCIGIIGGKPKHSLFFVGFQDEHLLYLDPHYGQSTVDVSADNFPLESYHCKTVRKMSFSRMDPSCTIGFYAKSKRDFETLCLEVAVAHTSSAPKYPIFTFSEGCGHVGEWEGERETTSNQAAHIPRNENLIQKRRSSIDDFVFL